tara:strand:+ start:415 stop:588 length:174 start_codon:yes stop_codon:yes gene_type:complete
MKKIKFIPCSEDSQIYSWQRTNRKATAGALNGPCGAYEVRKIKDVKAALKKRKNKCP